MDTHAPNSEMLLSLDHYEHRQTFLSYLANHRHVRNKQDFLFAWINPQKDDVILECGSSSGKTCIDLSMRGGCYCLGVDIDPFAVKISKEMRDTYFPQLKERCHFTLGDLGTMKFDIKVAKVIMPDFTEHISDSTFAKILDNIRIQLPRVHLYIYTPSRTHIFEIMKHKNFILKKISGHINVKSEKDLKQFLERHGWKIKEVRWKVSHIPLFRSMEFILGLAPIVGPLFRRRIAIIAYPAQV